MILIQLEGGGPQRFRLEFHPKVTVVSGLSAHQRHELAASITGALAGGDVGMQVMVDVGGQPQWLTPDLIARLGLAREPVDNVIEPADLPGAVVKGVPGTQVEPARPQPVISAPDDGPLAGARDELQRAQAKAGEAAQRLQDAQTNRLPVDSQEIAVAQGAQERLRARVLELRAALQMLGGANAAAQGKEERIARMEDVRASIESRMVELKGILESPMPDPERIRSLLAATIAAGEQSDDRELRSTIDELLQSFASANHRHEQLSHQPQPPEWLVAQTKDDLDEAQARINAFTYQLQEGIDVKQPLERAQQQLAQAQVAWEEIENGVAGQLMAVENERSNLYQRACALLGNEVGMHAVEEALRGERGRIDSAPNPSEDLAVALRSVGIDAKADNARLTAEDWLRSHDSEEARRAGLQREMAKATVDLNDVLRQINDLRQQPEAPPVDPREVERLTAELATAEQAERDASANLRDVQESVLRGPQVDELLVAKLDFDYRQALEEMEAAGRKVDYFARLSTLRGDESGEPESSYEPEASADPDRPWWEGRSAPVTHRAVPITAEVDVDVSGVVHQDVDMYVLSRAAGLRLVGRGESVPLVIDAAFDQLPAPLAQRILEALAKIASIVQVVYLSSNDVAEKWARRQDELLAAVVHLERA